MITYTTATKTDLEGILALQPANLPTALSPYEIKTQGFLTLRHSLDLLQRMNTIERHIIGKSQSPPIVTSPSVKSVWNYQAMYQLKYDFAITPIADRNQRSLRAHQRIGFQPIHSFKEGDGTEWWIVVWNF